jgi:hypothetical protein
VGACVDGKGLGGVVGCVDGLNKGETEGSRVAGEPVGLLEGAAVEHIPQVAGQTN